MQVISDEKAAAAFDKIDEVLEATPNIVLGTALTLASGGLSLGAFKAAVFLSESGAYGMSMGAFAASAFTAAVAAAPAVQVVKNFIVPEPSE